MDIFVDVKIHPTVREFIMCTNGSDMIIPNKGDWLWLLLKQHLTVVSNDYNPISVDERSNYIRIKLLDSSGSKVYNDTMNKTGKQKQGLYLKTLFRNTLTEKGQSIIALHLRKQFKSVFHNYMCGAVSGGMPHKDAIEKFCELYKLELNEISYDMLKKSWQRSSQKSILKQFMSFCPIIF